MNIVVFDVETRVLAPKGKDLDDSTVGEMGVSVACAFDYATGEYTVHLEDNLKALWKRLVAADLVVGFNINRFDIPVVGGHMTKIRRAMGPGPDAPFEDPGRAALEGDLVSIGAAMEAMRRKSYDLYVEVKAGAKADKYHRGYKCDDVLAATFGEVGRKTGNGADAPDLWRDGKIGKLATYCLSDVHRERMIFEQCWRNGTLRAFGFEDGKTDIPVVRPQTRLGLAEPWPTLPWAISVPEKA